MTTRRAVQMACIIVLLALVSSTAVPAAAEEVTLDVWFWKPNDQEVLQALSERFEAENPGISVSLTLIPGNVDAYSERLQLAAASGAVPDVALVNRTEVLPLARKGVFSPLPDQLTGLLQESFIPWAWNSGIYRGQLYSVPWATDVRGLWWNKALFEEAGLTADRGPASLDELAEYARKLTQTGDGGQITQLGFAPWIGNWNGPGWIWAFDGEIFDPTTLTAVVDSDAAVAAFEWVQDWAERYPPQTWASQLLEKRPFLNGTVGMVAHVNVFLKRIKDTNPDMRIGSGAVPHAPGGANGSWAGGPGLAVPVGAPHPGEAHRFVQFAASKESQVFVYSESGQLPTRFDAVQAAYSLAPPEERAFLDQLPTAHARVPLWREVMRALDLEPLVAGEISAVEFTRQAQEKLDAAYAHLFGADQE